MRMSPLGIPTGGGSRTAGRWSWYRPDPRGSRTPVPSPRRRAKAGSGLGPKRLRSIKVDSPPDYISEEGAYTFQKVTFQGLTVLGDANGVVHLAARALAREHP